MADRLREFLLDLAVDAALLPRAEDPARPRQIVAPIAGIDIGPLDGTSGQRLGLRDDILQGVAVVRATGQFAQMMDRRLQQLGVSREGDVLRLHRGVHHDPRQVALLQGAGIVSEAQGLMLHRARELLVRQRTMVINALRGHCAEFGLIVAQGASRVEELVAIIEDSGDERLPPLAREALGSLVEQLCSAQARIKQLEATLMAWHRSNEASRRLATIPGVGVITATALVATIGDGAQFRLADSSRPGSVWCPDSTRVAARTGWGGYRSAGMAT